MGRKGERGKKQIRFISMDPSLSNTALVWGSIIDGELYPEDWVLAKTRKSQEGRVGADTVRRCRYTLDTIRDIVEEIDPDVCFAETPSGSKSSHAAKSYGASCCFIASLPTPVVEVTPKQLKGLTAGSGASKVEIMDWAEDLFPDFPFDRHLSGAMVVGKMEHVADAIGAVYAGMKTDYYKELEEEYGW